MQTINDVIAAMKKTPGMFSPDLSLAPLETYLIGYRTCLDLHDIKETHAGRTFVPSAFSAWLYAEKGWSGARGFARAIEEHTKSPQAAWASFFELVQQFRNSTIPDKV